MKSENPPKKDSCKTFATALQRPFSAVSRLKSTDIFFVVSGVRAVVRPARPPACRSGRANRVFSPVGRPAIRALQAVQPLMSFKSAWKSRLLRSIQASEARKRGPPFDENQHLKRIFARARHEKPSDPARCYLVSAWIYSFFRSFTETNSFSQMENRYLNKVQIASRPCLQVIFLPSS